VRAEVYSELLVRDMLSPSCSHERVRHQRVTGRACVRDVNASGLHPLRPGVAGLPPRDVPPDVNGSTSVAALSELQRNLPEPRRCWALSVDGLAAKSCCCSFDCSTARCLSLTHRDHRPAPRLVILLYSAGFAVTDGLVLGDPILRERALAGSASHSAVHLGKVHSLSHRAVLVSATRP
jgi:hypothetical protein